jgi:hypothetical protein
MEKCCGQAARETIRDHLIEYILPAYMRALPRARDVSLTRLTLTPMEI